MSHPGSRGYAGPCSLCGAVQGAPESWVFPAIVVTWNNTADHASGPGNGYESVSLLKATRAWVLKIFAGLCTLLIDVAQWCAYSHKMWGYLRVWGSIWPWVFFVILFFNSYWIWYNCYIGSSLYIYSEIEAWRNLHFWVCLYISQPIFCPSWRRIGCAHSPIHGVRATTVLLGEIADTREFKCTDTH